MEKNITRTGGIFCDSRDEAPLAAPALEIERFDQWSDRCDGNARSVRMCYTIVDHAA